MRQPRGQGRGMTAYSIGDVKRRLATALDEAQRRPVIIKRHGRARAAIISMRCFDIYETLIRKEFEQMAAKTLHDSIKATREGRLTTAAQLRIKARDMAQRGECAAQARHRRRGGLTPGAMAR